MEGIQHTAVESQPKVETAFDGLIRGNLDLIVACNLLEGVYSNAAIYQIVFNTLEMSTSGK